MEQFHFIDVDLQRSSKSIGGMQQINHKASTNNQPIKMAIGLYFLLID